MAVPTFALGLIGQGIGASLTPAVHEAEGRAQGLGLTYRRIELGEDGVHHLADYVHWARVCGLDGFNVTHPAKQLIIPLLSGVSPMAERIGAVNTVVATDGQLVGHNTDGVGFVRGLDRYLSGALDTRVLQIGTGGAGVAIAHAMLDRGVPHLTVFDIAADRREQLAAALAGHYGSDRVSVTSDPAVAIHEVDGLVNATPIGMDHHPGTPVSPDLLRPELWVADVIYSPATTPLLAAAQALGCRTTNGMGMAIYQAVAAFEIFTGRPADAERMATVYHEQLAQRGY